jgi:hypothetical protein
MLLLQPLDWTSAFALTSPACRGVDLLPQLARHRGLGPASPSSFWMARSLLAQ